PFNKLPFLPENGQGMNPLLQNPGMIFHPPTLYLGYVGFTIPFAFAIAALITGQLGEGWLKSTRGWIIFSWYTLGIGILFGANWAYQVLGWGGYWAWDPVENASLIPWLTGTAFLHSIMIQEKRGMLKIWNMVLIILTFLLCIFGTFITRSGVISSVHSFARSSIGYYFIIFILVSCVYSFWLVGKRKEELTSERPLDSLLSRESSFLFNNLILVGAAFAVFWGTVFPIVSEAVRGTKVTVGPPFFNRIMTPIGFALLLLTGICPLISWNRATWSNFKKNFLIPSIFTVIFFVILYVAGIRHIKAAVSFSLCFFVFITILLEYYRGTRARMQVVGEGIIRAFVNLNLKNRRRYGGYLIHIAMLMIFAGITGSSAFSIEKEVVLRKGESVEIKNYKITYSDFKIERKMNKFVAQAELLVMNNEKNIGTMKPVKAFYFNQMDQPVSEVSIRTGLKEDLYAILAGYDEFGKTAVFKFLVNPLVIWIWLGGVVMTAGTLLAVWPEKKRNP
ncbi:MAG: cytochrome c-type biogenesis CcmF C-terminal domain-containing protein, partial [Candidatus Aenigmatarchaeota archaeon]